MRGLRDVLLVAAVAVATVALGMIGAGIHGSTPEFTTADSVTLGMARTRVGASAIERHRPEVSRAPVRTAIEVTPRLASRPGTPTERRRERHSVAASPEPNDLRTFLKNMARATRDGNAIGILGPDATPNWVDDEAKSDR